MIESEKNFVVCKRRPRADSDVSETAPLQIAPSPEETTYAGVEEHTPILSPTYNRDEAWVQEYIRQFGREPSFF